MSKSRHLVFIDDSPEDCATFERLYGDRFQVTAIPVQQPAGAAERVAARLGKRVPDLFVLDLFFRQTADLPQQISYQASIAACAQIASIARAAGSLPEKFSEPTTLLKNAHGVVSESQWLLSLLCQEFQQSPSSGVCVLRELESRYAAVPKIFYSRKATIADVKEAIKQGALDVLSKPHPSVEEREARRIGDLFERYCGGQPPAWLWRQAEARAASRRERK